MMAYNDGTVKAYITKREIFLYDNDCICIKIQCNI